MHEERAPEGAPPPPDASPFDQPKVSEGYPLTPEEKEEVDQVVEKSRETEERD